jgi:hypothetical protein
MGENSLILATLVPCVAALPIRNSDELHLNNALLFPGSDEQFSLTQLSRGTTQRRLTKPNPHLFTK